MPSRYKKRGVFTREKTCLECGLMFIAHATNRKHCEACQEKHKRQKVRFGQRICTATTGAISEMAVSLDLLCRGYEVFRSLSPACSCDLIISRNGTCIRTEVKTLAYNQSAGSYAKTKAFEAISADLIALVSYGNSGKPIIQYVPPLHDGVVVK